MRKIIRSLIPRSIENEIKNEALRDLGGRILADDPHWFNRYPILRNLLYAIGRDLKE